MIDQEPDINAYLLEGNQKTVFLDTVDIFTEYDTSVYRLLNESPYQSTRLQDCLFQEDMPTIVISS